MLKANLCTSTYYLMLGSLFESQPSTQIICGPPGSGPSVDETFSEPSKCPQTSGSFCLRSGLFWLPLRAISGPYPHPTLHGCFEMQKGKCIFANRSGSGVDFKPVSRCWRRMRGGGNSSLLSATSQQSCLQSVGGGGSIGLAVKMSDKFMGPAASRTMVISSTHVQHIINRMNTHTTPLQIQAKPCS